MWKSVALVVLGISALVQAHCHHDEDGPPIVTTPLGKIKGTVFTSREGRPIYSFRGVRYAQPPVGELRFKPPVPVNKWDNVLNATVDGPRCPQIVPVVPGIGEDRHEDCLRLNVYTTKIPEHGENVKKPVVVFFHQGAFHFHSAVSYYFGPQYFLDRDIVLVPVNYRLGALGFLSTGDALCPGNNGLKDQVAALKWVKKNIAAFGGDPNNVVLMGYSAGSYSISLHLVSPMSKGLFHKAIAMSGSMLGFWPMFDNQLDIAKKQARFSGCPDDTTENIIKCLRTKPAEELGTSYPKFWEFGTSPTIVWGPVVEKDFGQERFLTDHPIRLIMEGHLQNVPLITGFTRDEFAFAAEPLFADKDLIDKLNQDFYTYGPILLGYERNSSKSIEVSDAIRKFYFGGNHLDNSSIPGMKKALVDGIGFQNHRFAKLMAQFSNKPTYYYQMTLEGRYSYFYKPGTNDTVPYGVSHHDDLIYLFYSSALFPYLNDSSPEAHMVTKLTTLYANFVKTGNPTPTRSPLLDNILWEPYNLQTQKYLDEGKRFTIKEKLLADRFKLYEDLYPLSYYKNYPYLPPK